MERSIRIGKDFNVLWSINKVVDGERQPYELAGKELVLQYRTPYGLKEATEWKTEGNTIVWTFRGREQKSLGSYELILTENGGKDGMVTVDTCRAFKLVAHSCEETEGSGSDIVIEDVVLESEVTFAALRGPQGEQGPAGPQGPQGERGPEGPQGPAGPSYNDTEIKGKLAELSEETKEIRGNIYNSFTYETTKGYVRLDNLIPFAFKKGARVINKGVMTIVTALTDSLDNRQDIAPNSEIILDSDKGYIGTSSSVGLVNIEYYNPRDVELESAIAEIHDNVIKEQQHLENKLITSINLINPNEVDYDKYIYQGELYSNSSYNTTGYILVESDKTYALVATGGHTQANARFISFFDADKKWVSDGANYLKEVVIPSGVAYIRVSYDTLYWEVAQINIGNAVSYQSYKEIIDPALIDAKTLDLTFINKMSSFRGVATLGASQKIELQKNYISRNVEVSGIIKGSIQSVEIGLGKGSFYGGYIELTPTHVYVFDGSSKVSEHEHGLTLGEKVFVSIRTAKEPNSYNNKTATIELRTQGQVFSKANIYFAGRGAAFIQNNGNSSVEVSLSFLPCYINAPIWMFGDSYFEWADKTRWIAQSIKNGNMHFLDCGLSGGISNTLFTSFVNLLTIGLPKIAVWCLGMNDGSDTTDAPSASWLSNIKSFITTCNNSNITPILATIPSVPSVYNEKKNEWVRNSGYRYIDFASAVGATSSGQWDEGLLSADGVHPSEKGGIMLYAQALVDCPEIANS